MPLSTPTLCTEKAQSDQGCRFVQKPCRPCENNSRSRNLHREERAVAQFADFGRGCYITCCDLRSPNTGYSSWDRAAFVSRFTPGRLPMASKTGH
jgi:hypothetical protein